MLGISTGEEPAVAQAFADAFGITFPVLIDRQGWVYFDYRAPFGTCTSPFPLDYVIDRDGIVRYWRCEYDPVGIIDTIEGLLAAGTGVSAATPPMAAGLELEPSRPNPFNPYTRIAFRLPISGDVRLTIYDQSGRTIRTLARGPHAAGRHVTLWDGRDDRGRAVACGVYLYRLTGPVGSATDKVTLVR